MNSKLRTLKDKYFDYSMLRWGIVGLFTFIVDFIIFINLYGSINSVFLANLISSTIATSINYYSHYRWTFKSNQNHSKTSAKYLLNLAFWWLVSTSIIKGLILVDFNPKIAKIMPIFLVSPINYYILTKFVYKQTK